MGQQFQLAPPILKYHSAFFSGSTTASLQFAQPGTEINYTLNGDEPKPGNIVYHTPITITKSLTTLKAKVFGIGFLPSQTVQVTFIKDGLKIKSIETPTPNERFTGNGSSTLFDNEGGIPDMHNKNFLGYQQDSVLMIVTLEKKQIIKSVLLDFLRDEGSWIFLPQSIRIYYFDDAKNSYHLMGIKGISSDTAVHGGAAIFEVIPAIKKVKAVKLKIIITPLQSMPEGHPGQGKPAWLFIDEIKIY